MGDVEYDDCVIVTMMVTWANCYYDDGDDDDEGVIVLMKATTLMMLMTYLYEPRNASFIFACRTLLYMNTFANSHKHHLS